MTQKSFIGYYASRNLFFMHLIYFINIRTTSAAKERLRNQKLFLQILFVIGLHQIITGSTCEIFWFLEKSVQASPVKSYLLKIPYSLKIEILSIY